MKYEKLKNRAKTVVNYADRAYTKLNDWTFQYLGTDILGFLMGDTGGQPKLRTVSIIDDNDTTIKIDWCKISSDDMSSSLKTKALEDKDNTLITSNIEKSNRSISIECRMNMYEETAYERYYALRELWNTKAIITLDFIERVENLVVLSIGRPIENESELVFTLSFEQIEFAKVKRVAEIHENYHSQLTPEKNTGLQGVAGTEIPPQALLITGVMR